MMHLKNSGALTWVDQERLTIFNEEQVVPFNDFEKIPAIEILKHLHQKKFDRILFGPCEHDYMLAELVLLWPEAKIDVITPLEKKKFAYAQQFKNIRRLNGNLENFVTSLKYDLVFIPRGIHHLKHPHQSIASWVKLLDKGGVLAISFFSEIRKTFLEPLWETLNSGNWKAGVQVMIENLENLDLISEKFQTLELPRFFKSSKFYLLKDTYQLTHTNFVKRLMARLRLLEVLEKGLGLAQVTILERLWKVFESLYRKEFYNSDKKAIDVPFKRAYFIGEDYSIQPPPNTSSP